MQLSGIKFEWIPYNQFNEIKETGINGSITVNSAIWMDGPLYYDYLKEEYTRNSNKKVALKCLCNSQYSIDFLINEAKKYLTNKGEFHKLFGISQDSITNNYILVQNNSINITNWISGNEKIDDFIQEMQLKIDTDGISIIEWIPYNKFNEIKETCKNGSITVYSAIWKDGPLQYNYSKCVRDPNKEVALKCFCNFQYSIDFLIKEVYYFFNV
uniref:Protein kinase domain-containing protein n=1 Tax=Rhizophagus irregularis (strain DAOM 181602 / DAOM 197198 / MUCL 43194) TaxID=747089 RepID=U9TB65_RHIID